MVRRNKRNLATWLLAAATTCGCANQSPWDTSPAAYPPGAAPGTPWGSAAPGQGAAGNPMNGTPQGIPGAPATDPLGTPPPQAAVAASGFSGSMVLASMRQAGTSVAKSLQIQPKVIPAPDPVKLDSFGAADQSVAAELHYHAGRVFETQNSLPSAAAHYRDALARSPRDVKLLVSYARVLDRMGNVQEADKLYRQAIEIDPNNASTYNDLAMCHARHGNVDLALGTLQRAVRLEPANPLFRNNFAVVLVDADRHEEAFQHLRDAHGEAIAHYNLGYLLLERNARDAAVFHFQRALNVDPGLDVARDMLLRLLLAP
ncbi:MAG: tetratricopeptide repeat protein, partial [Pirellulaceae bacterium]